MRNTTFTRLLPFLVVALALLGSCVSQPKDIPEDLEPIEYFQRAQNIVSENENYKLAVKYYQTFIERYPDDIQRIVEAKYEIAFLSYKQGNYDQARQQFEELLSYYEDEGSQVLPRWPKVLAQKVLEKINSDDTPPVQPAPQNTESPARETPGAQAVN